MYFGSLLLPLSTDSVKRFSFPYYSGKGNPALSPSLNSAIAAPSPSIGVPTTGYFFSATFFSIFPIRFFFSPGFCNRACRADSPPSDVLWFFPIPLFLLVGSVDLIHSVPLSNLHCRFALNNRVSGLWALRNFSLFFFFPKRLFLMAGPQGVRSPAGLLLFPLPAGLFFFSPGPFSPQKLAEVFTAGFFFFSFPLWLVLAQTSSPPALCGCFFHGGFFMVFLLADVDDFSFQYGLSFELLLSLYSSFFSRCVPIFYWRFFSLQRVCPQPFESFRLAAREFSFSCT